MTTQEVAGSDPVRDAVDRYEAAQKAKDRAQATLNRAAEAYEEASRVERSAMEERDLVIGRDPRSPTVLARVAKLSRGRVSQIKSDKAA